MVSYEISFAVFDEGMFMGEAKTSQKFPDQWEFIKSLLAFAAQQSAVNTHPRVIPLYTTCPGIHLPVHPKGYGPNTRLVITSLRPC